MIAPARKNTLLHWTAIAAIAVLFSACNGGASSTTTPPAATDAVMATITPAPQITALTQTAPTPSPPHPHVVAISAGHGGPRNTGAVHKDRAGNVDLIEKDLNLDVARRLDPLLRADGYTTVLLRDGDYSVSPEGGAETPDQIRAESQARADLANQAHADALVVIHHNGSDDPLVAGTEVYFNPERSFGDQSRRFAQAIHDGIITRLRAVPYAITDRGVKSDAPIGARYGQPHTYLFGEAPGFRSTTMPAVLGEALFVSNDAEAVLLLRDDVKQAIAEGYRDGVEAYFQ